MCKNILKIYFGFCLLIFYSLTFTYECEISKISAIIVDDLDENLIIEPFVRVGKKFYYFAEEKVSWFKASLKCRSIGGYLASVNNAEEFQELTKYMTPKYSTDIWWWLSGSDLDKQFEFFWFRTGEPIKYGWTSDQPDNASGNERCVHLWYQNNRHELNDLHCNHQAYYICEADKPKTVSVSLF